MISNESLIKNRATVRYVSLGVIWFHSAQIETPGAGFMTCPNLPPKRIKISSAKSIQFLLKVSCFLNRQTLLHRLHWKLDRNIGIFEQHRPKNLLLTAEAQAVLKDHKAMNSFILPSPCENSALKAARKVLRLIEDVSKLLEI